MVVAVGGVGAVAVTGHAHGDGARPDATAAASVAFAVVTRQDLVNRQTLSRSLGFGPKTDLKGAGSGTPTKLPSVGATTSRSKALLSADARPVPIFSGDTPFFRELGTVGTIGPDVTVVTNNLATLGYDVGDAVPVQGSSNKANAVERHLHAGARCGAEEVAEGRRPRPDRRAAGRRRGCHGRSRTREPGEGRTARPGRR